MLRAMSTRRESTEATQRRGATTNIHDVSNEEQKAKAPQEEVEEVEAL